MKAFIVLAVLACAYAKPGFLSTYGGFPYSAGIAAPYTAAYHGTPYAAYSPYAVAAAPVHYAAPAAVVAPAFSKTQYHAQDELGQASYGYAHPGQAHSAVRDAAGNVQGSYAYINPDGNEIRVNYRAGAGGFQVESNALPQAPVHIVPAAVAGPAPVQDTPEVVEARAAHFQAHAEAKARSLRKKRGIVGAHHAVALTHTPAHTYSAAYPGLAYSALHHPAALTYGAYPAAFGYSTAAVHHAPLAYSAAAYPALGYSAAVLPTHAVRDATLTKVVNTPGHAVSYRVD